MSKGERIGYQLTSTLALHLTPHVSQNSLAFLGISCWFCTFLNAIPVVPPPNPHRPACPSRDILCMYTFPCITSTDSLLCMPFYTLLFSLHTYLHVRAVSFYFTNVYYSIEWINHNLFNQSPSDGHFHCFLSFAIKNNAVMNVLVQMLFHIISMGLCLWVQFLEIRVVFREGDWVDGYRIGRLFIVSPFVSL